jgi:hypothetical protein
MTRLFADQGLFQYIKLEFANESYQFNKLREKPDITVQPVIAYIYVGDGMHPISLYFLYFVLPVVLQVCKI